MQVVDGMYKATLKRKLYQLLKQNLSLFSAESIWDKGHGMKQTTLGTRLWHLG